MTGRPAKAWHAWGLLCVAMFVATPAIPSGAATNGSRAPGLLLNLTQASTDTDKVVGNIGGVLVVGTFNTATAQLVVDPKGTRPKVKFLSGKLSCATGSCSIDGELLGAPLAGFTLGAKFAGPFKNSNGYATLTRLFGSLERLYGDHDAWVSAVAKWTDAHLGVAEARARVVAQAAGPVAPDESSGAGSPAAAVDPTNGPGGAGGSGNADGGGASGSGGNGGHGGAAGSAGGTSGSGGSGTGSGSGGHGGGGGGGPHR
ncbi:MAG TPA: hypothetical protein VEZ44_02365 [bacterium]|nr:hypothetical protein [bacterium]